MTKVIITSAVLLIHNAVNMKRLTGLKQRLVFLPFQYTHIQSKFNNSIFFVVFYYSIQFLPMSSLSR